MMESVLEGMSEYYSQNLAREVMKGMRETALQCKHTGGKPPLGYEVDPQSKNCWSMKRKQRLFVASFLCMHREKGIRKFYNTCIRRDTIPREEKSFKKQSV